MVGELAAEQMLTDQEKEFCDRLYQLFKNQILQQSRGGDSVNAAFLDNNSSHKHKSGNHSNGGRNNG